MPAETPREALAAREALLAGCALRAADSGGRAFPEPPHPYRSCYQRDRDRVVHCSAFRRLDYKTQVFVPHEQDHYRTRLTHTLEVAQIARTLAWALGANEDVVEAVALAHDLGHPPFGHAGEGVLNELMAGEGGFEHNRQSLRIVDHLEHPYPDFRGLNLTRAVRSCLAKHRTRHDAPEIEEFADGLEAPLEGQLVDLADEIAYTAADLADALSAKWIATEQLAGLALWREAWRTAESAMPHARDIHKRIHACRNVLARLADDAIAETRGRIQEMHLASPADVQRAPMACAGFSERWAGPIRQLQEFLMEHVYEHPAARAKDGQARKIITELFEAYLESPARLPERYQRRIPDQGIHRVACDYIAGMTDRFCREEHDRVTRGAR